ncbi:MAG: ABC transporter transmembrane domain-containing protein, partial [Acidobacteriaceae bacterium]
MLENLRPLFPYLRRYRRGLLIGGFFAVCSNGIWILFPEVIRRAIDDMTQHLSYRGILLYAGLLLAVALSKGVFLFLTRWVLIGISRDIEYDLRNDLFRVLEKQSLSYYQTNRTGDIMARATNDLSAVRMLLGPAIMYSTNTFLFTVGALVFMVRISPWLTLLAFVPLPAASILVQYFGRRIHERFERIQAMYSDISAQVQENVAGARMVRAFAQEDAEIHAFERANTEYIRRALRLVRLMGMLWPTLEFMLGLSLVVVLLVGGHEVVTHRISVGAFVAFTTYMVMLTWPVIALGWVVNLVQRGTASVRRIHEILIAEPSISDATLNVVEPVAAEIRGDIEFRNLSFTYDNATVPVLRNINLRIPAGSSFALVGPTGSGKTT